MSNETPYTTMIDASNYSGKHRLKAIATFSNGKTLTTESNIQINSNNSDIKVEIDGDRVYFDQEPLLYNNRTMVPMRKIFEDLGAKVTWDEDTQTAIGRKGDRTVRVTIGQKTMYVNNTRIELDTPPFVLSGRTLVPARAIAEGLGCEVDWNDGYNLVSITPQVFRWSDLDEDLLTYVDGKKYRCSNTCYRWYLIETTGGNFTRYRSRPIHREYVYWEWGDWSRWSSWDDNDPYDYYDWDDNSVDVDERLVYRYKEKG